MSKRTCNVPDCNRPHVARGVCPMHYQRALKAGTLPPIAPKPAPHELTDVDSESRTATCSICGPSTPYRMRAKKPACEPFTLAREKKARLRAKAEGNEKINAYHRNYTRHRNYRLPKGGVVRMLELADWKCQVCRREVTERTARIDHDHDCCATVPTCGRCVRGILCNPCNSGIGLLGDNLEGLLAAVEYLTAQRALFQVA